jgi:hypothetical protein
LILPSEASPDSCNCSRRNIKITRISPQRIEIALQNQPIIQKQISIIANTNVRGCERMRALELRLIVEKEKEATEMTYQIEVHFLRRGSTD